MYNGPTTTAREAPQQLYGFTVNNNFSNTEGYPSIKPPLDSLTAINMNTGEKVWKLSFGEFEGLKAK